MHCPWIVPVWGLFPEISCGSYQAKDKKNAPKTREQLDKMDVKKLLKLAAKVLKKTAKEVNLMGTGKRIAKEELIELILSAQAAKPAAAATAQSPAKPAQAQAEQSTPTQVLAAESATTAATVGPARSQGSQPNGVEGWQGDEGWDVQQSPPSPTETRILSPDHRPKSRG